MRLFGFGKGEIREGLLGGLEAALLMPALAGRFPDDRDSALRSFVVPILLFPLTLMGLYLFPRAGFADHSANTVALLSASRLVLSWLAYFICVYVVVREVGRKEHFWSFVAANNWLSVPATVIFAPVAFLLLTGRESWDDLYPVMVFLTLYSYAFTAFAAVHVLRVPWELGGFIAIMGLIIHEQTGQIAGYISSIL